MDGRMDIWTQTKKRRYFRWFSGLEPVRFPQREKMTDADRHSDLMESVRSAAAGLAAAKAAATAARKAAGLVLPSTEDLLLDSGLRRGNSRSVVEALSRV